MIVELTSGDVEVVSSDMHEGLSINSDWHTQDELLNFFTFLLDLVLVHTLNTDQLEVIIFSSILEITCA